MPLLTRRGLRARSSLAALVLITALGPAGAAAARAGAGPGPSPTAAAACRDAYEDDGIPAQAHPIQPGAAQRHTFCPAGDADWLAFAAPAGARLRVRTRDLAGGVDAYLYLFAADGQTVLGYAAAAPGAPGPAALTFTAPAAGRYYVMVKNQGDAGGPDAAYTVALDALPEPTAPAPPIPSAAPPATLPPASAPPAPAIAPVAPTATPPPAPTAPLLVAQPGDAGGLPVIGAGPAEARAPDALEPNDRADQAAPLDLGARYANLNFVPEAPGTADADFYRFRAKPGDCYLVQTGDLSPGLDTTLLLWAVPAPPAARRLVAQNDDAHPHTADLSSRVRWCSDRDSWAIVEVHNYGLAPPTDPRGKTYSLRVQIDPPPTPTARPTAPPASAPPPAPAPPPAAPAPERAPAPTLPAPPTPASPTPVPAPPAPPPPATRTAAPPASATPVVVTVDVIAYVAEPGALGPLSGDGIVGWPVQLVDQATNALLRTVATDANGHARLTWPWQGPVWIELPALGWSHLVGAPQGDPAVGGGPLYARKEAYPLPGIWP